MALKDKWKDAGKSIGGAFSNLGKAIGTTAKIVAGKEEKRDEEGNNNFKEAWKKTGKGFGKAGKSLGKAAKGTVDKVFDEEKETEDIKKEEKDIIEVEVIEEKKDE